MSQNPFPCLTGRHPFLPPSGAVDTTALGRLLASAPPYLSEALAAVNGKGHAPLRVLIDLERDLHAEIESSGMLYPPSAFSVREHLLSRLRDNPGSQSSWLFSLLYPDIAKDLASDAGLALPSTGVLAAFPRPEAAPKTGKDKPPAPDLTAWFSDTLSAAMQVSPSWSVRREFFDDHIKKGVLEKKGAGKDAFGYWFQDCAFPALCRLPEEDLLVLAEVWPRHNLVRHTHPEAMFSDHRFWSEIRFSSTKDRKVILEQVLPTILDTSAWSVRDRVDILESLSARTEKHAWLFTERLKLWSDLGGQLDQDYVLAPAQGFSSPMMATARDWVLSRNIDGWTQALPAGRKPPSP